MVKHKSANLKNIEFIELIKLRFPDINFKEIESNDEIYLEFRPVNCKSFKFKIWVESLWTITGIDTILDSEPKTSFWNNEIMFYPSSDNVNSVWIKESKSEIIKTLDILIKKPIRIILRKKCLSTSFKCEYYDNNNWNLIWETIEIFGGIVPKTTKKLKIYE